MAVELDVGHPVLLPPRTGEVVGASDEHHRIELLSDRDELHVTWTVFGPRRDGAGAHVHRRHSDLFYVLDGELTILVGPDRAETALPVGTLVLAPPLVVHGFRNASDAELRYLNFHAPGGGFADYLRGVTPGFDSEDPPADGGRPAGDAVVVAAGTTGVLVEQDGIRVALRELGGAGASPGRLISFYVLEGELVITASGNELRATEGTWVQIPPGLEHALEPTGARVLEIQT
jgi:mannose-6-phosphate isomerase-like protein (cupin superfamily)